MSNFFFEGFPNRKQYYQQDIRPASELAPGAVAMRVLVVEQGLHGAVGHSLHHLRLLLLATGA